MECYGCGFLFQDTAKLFFASLLVKNMGFQLKKYEGTDGDDLPFDLQIGISKRMEKAPFGFSLTAQRLHQYNIRYNDTTFNNENGFPMLRQKNSVLANCWITWYWQQYLLRR